MTCFLLMCAWYTCMVGDCEAPAMDMACTCVCVCVCPCLRVCAQGVSNSLYGAALLGLQPHDTWMNPALDSLQSQCQRMEPQHLANTMWALARMGYYPGKLRYYFLTVTLCMHESQGRHKR